MEYITCVKFDYRNKFGKWSQLPRGAKVEEIDGLIALGEIPLCYNKTKVAYHYFSRNNDSHGFERWRLCQKITRNLDRIDNKSAKRWQAIYASDKAWNLREDVNSVFWTWGFEFYNAEISELQEVWDLIKNI